MDLDLGLIVIFDLDTYEYKQNNFVFAAICVLCCSYSTKSRDAYLIAASDFFSGITLGNRRNHTIQTLYTTVNLLKPNIMQLPLGIRVPFFAKSTG